MSVSIAKVKTKVRWTAGVFFFVSGLVITTWTSRIPDIQQKFQLSNAELGWILFASNAGLVCALPFTSWVIARFSSSRMMMIGAIIYVLVLPVLAFSNATWQIVFLLFLFGASRTFLSMSANTNAIEIQKLYHKPIVAKFHGIWSLACFAGIGLSALMISQSVSPFIHFTGVAIVVLAIILAFKRKKQKAFKRGEKRPLFVKPDRYLLLLGLITFCSMSCESAMFDWSINYFDKVVKSDKTYVTAGYTSFIIMFTIGRLIGDRLIAKFGTLAMLFSSGVMMATGFMISIFFPSIWLASAGFSLVGFGGSIIVPMVYTLAGKNEKMLPTYAIVSVTMLGYIGFLTCPLFMGMISEQWGMQSAFGLMAVYAIIISLLVVLMKKLNITA